MQLYISKQMISAFQRGGETCSPFCPCIQHQNWATLFSSIAGVISSKSRKESHDDDPHILQVDPPPCKSTFCALKFSFSGSNCSSRKLPADPNNFARIRLQYQTVSSHPTFENLKIFVWRKGANSEPTSPINLLKSTLSSSTQNRTLSQWSASVLLEPNPSERLTALSCSQPPASYAASPQTSFPSAPRSPGRPQGTSLLDPPPRRSSSSPELLHT